MRNTDGIIATKKNLTVKGIGLPSDILTKFSDQHPDISLTIDDSFIDDANLLISQMLAGEDLTDIFILPDYSGIWSMADKGYFANLEHYEKIRNSVLRMHSKIQEKVLKDGQIRLIPISLGMNAWIFRPDLFLDAGFEAMPTTLIEYLELLKDWENEKKEDKSFVFHNGFFLRLG